MEVSALNKSGAIHERVRRYAQCSTDQLKQELQIPETGLDAGQVAQARHRYGANRVDQKNQTSLPRCVYRAFVNPFSVILLVLALISLITHLLLPRGYGEGLSSVFIILVMLLISGAVRLSQELHARRVANRLTDLVETTSAVYRAGEWREVPAEELVVGDRVRLEAGDRVPADLRLVETRALFVSQSPITGESDILEKTPEPVAHPGGDVGRYSNTVFRGCTVTGGTGVGIVLAVGEDTALGSLSGVQGGRKRGFDRGANSIAWVLIKFMAILVPVVFLANGLTKGNWLEALLFALSVAVGLTPELLPMVVNACLARGGFQMGKKETVVKNINAMQGFGSMDILCVDKTGTLTSDQVLLEYYTDILGNECGRTLDYAYLNSLYHTGVRNHLDRAVLKAREMPGRWDYFQDLAARYPKLDEQPFDYRSKCVSVLLRGPETNLILVKGSVAEVVDRCGFVEYRGTVLEMGADGLRHVHAVTDEMTEAGMKVLAVAYKATEATELTGREDGFVLLGYLAFFDAPKQSAAGALEKLKRLHVDVRVLTGDETKTTVSVCRRLGIDTETVLTGEGMERLSQDELLIRVEHTRVFTQLSPGQKARIIGILQENGHSVGFLGDGMNDLPAEQKADVGISVDTALDAVKDSADVILLKNDLNVLEAGILEGRKAFVNMLKYIKITASSNFGNICAVIVASLLLPFFPMTSLQLLLLNLLYDLLCLVLPWDNVDEELLQRPLEWSGRTLGRFMTVFGPISSLFDVLTYAFLFFVLCPGLCGGGFSQLDPAGQARFIALFQTGWFLESMWTQVSILHLLRTGRVPLFQSRASLAVGGITALGIVLFTLLPATAVGNWLGLTVLPPAYYGFLLGTVVLYLLLISLAKLWYRKRYRELL